MFFILFSHSHNVKFLTKNAPIINNHYLSENEH